VGLDLLSILLRRLGMHRTSVRRVDGFAPESTAEISESPEEAAAHPAVRFETGPNTATARRSPAACALLRTAAQCAEQVRRVSGGARAAGRRRAARVIGG
jgi:hypothetical protein